MCFIIKYQNTICSHCRTWSPFLLSIIIYTSVFKIRSESCRTEAQFCQNLYIIKKESLLHWPKFCRSAVLALSTGPRISTTKNWAGPTSFPFGPASFSSFSCLKIFKDEFRAGKFWNLNMLNAKTGSGPAVRHLFWRQICTWLWPEHVYTLNAGRAWDFDF